MQATANRAAPRAGSLKLDRPPIPEVGTQVPRDARYYTEWNLENWARIMSTDELPDGCPVEAAVGENYTSLDFDNEDAYGAMCGRLAWETDKVISSLANAERFAIRHRYLGERYEWESVSKPYGVALACAIPLVTAGLRRASVWLGD